jgi:tetratricopeptide (TPR) repeat protein
MPTMTNGIGTWYYGKRRIHTITGVCEFCGRQADLASFDTSHFVVLFFVPVIPLGKKRVLKQCPYCQKFRETRLSNWEAAKARDGAEVLEKLRANPDDRDAIMRAIRFATGYQDEPLFRNVAETLAGHRTGDAELQTLLGGAYSYFSDWPRAEQAYRAALAVEDNEELREQLALTLLKQYRPEEARPYLQHVPDKGKRDSAGLVYLMVQHFQRLGQHREALEVIEQRDQAFPDFAKSKEYQKQRADSTRYRETDKKIYSAVLAKSKTGYREGNWTARVPGLIAASVFLGIVGLYLGSAAWIGYHRKVFLVNGTSQPYKVVVAGNEVNLLPQSATPVRVPEGEVQVAFAGNLPGLEPVTGRIETTFWGRPFVGHTFVINPDQSAVVVEEEAFYAEANPPPAGPPTVHFGEAFYSLPEVNFEFEPFPQSINVEGSGQHRRTRVGLSGLTPEQRLLVIQQKVQPEEQSRVCKTVLQLDPKNSPMLYFLASRLKPEETLQFVESRLDDRPLLVDWHRTYQSIMERIHPETDLRPRYSKLVAETNGQPDALYLLARAEPDPEEGAKQLRQAAGATPPSGYAINALGYRALCAGDFAEAKRLAKKAAPLVPDQNLVRRVYRPALLANGDYDMLLTDLQPDLQVPGLRASAITEMMLVHVLEGQKDKAAKRIDEAMQFCPPESRDAVRKGLEMTLRCYEQDVAGYLKSREDESTFETTFLRHQFEKAAEIASSTEGDKSTAHGLLYLAATRSGAKKMADDQWQALLAALGKAGRDERQFGEILQGRRPATGGLPQRLALEPSLKTVLLVVLAQRQPDQAKELLALARRLNYQRDVVSLCLAEYLPKP